MKKICALIALLCASQSVYAYKECPLTPEKVWLNNSGNNIWVCFEEGLCINKTNTMITEKVIDRTFSVAMAAISSGKSLIVRFDSDTFNCNVGSGSYTGYSGIWYVK